MNLLPMPINVVMKSKNSNSLLLDTRKGVFSFWLGGDPGTAEFFEYSELSDNFASDPQFSDNQRKNPKKSNLTNHKNFDIIYLQDEERKSTEKEIKKNKKSA